MALEVRLSVVSRSVAAIPASSPSAITFPRNVVEFAAEQYLSEFVQDSFVARTWRWLLHGGGPGPISHMDWR